MIVVKSTVAVRLFRGVTVIVAVAVSVISAVAEVSLGTMEKSWIVRDTLVV